VTPPARPPRVFVVGAGKVGLGLARALRDRGWTLAGVWNRGVARRRDARRLVGGPVLGGELPPGLGGADLVLVTVSDAAVPGVAALLAPARLPRRVVVAHTAGALPAAVLAPSGVTHLGALHPLLACADARQAARSLPGASFTIEGDPAAQRLLRRVVAALGGRAYPIGAAEKPRYHAALVLASNLAVALVELATREARRAGLADPRAVAALAQGAVALAAARGPRDALTGPVLRGDARTVAAHLRVLRGETRLVYALLSRVALELARERGLTPGAARAVARVLGGSRTGRARGRGRGTGRRRGRQE